MFICIYMYILIYNKKGKNVQCKKNIIYRSINKDMDSFVFYILIVLCSWEKLEK